MIQENVIFSTIIYIASFGDYVQCIMRKHPTMNVMRIVVYLDSTLYRNSRQCSASPIPFLVFPGFCCLLEIKAA